MTAIYAVHFLGANMRPRYGRARPWKVGETRTVKGELGLCKRGYHYSPTWEDAILGGFLYGPQACIVEVDDVGPRSGHKGVSATRTLVEAYDVAREMRLFAADEAERALREWETTANKAARIDSWKAVESARASAAGKITADELSASAHAALVVAAEAWSMGPGASWAAGSAALAWAWESWASWKWAQASARRFATAMHMATGWATVGGVLRKTHEPASEKLSTR